MELETMLVETNDDFDRRIASRGNLPGATVEEFQMLKASKRAVVSAEVANWLICEELAKEVKGE